MNLNDKNEVLAALEHLRDLFTQSYRLDDYINEGVFAESIESIKQLRGDLGALPRVPSVYANMPVFPIGKEAYEGEKKKAESWRLRLLIAAGVTVLSLLIYFISHKGFFNATSTIGIFVTAAFGYFYYTINKTVKENKKVYDASVERYNRTIQAFRTALGFYEEEAKDGIRAAREYAEKYRVAYQKNDSILEEGMQKRQEAMEENSRIMEEIGSNDFLPSEYYHLIPKLISLLKSGRADSYKEALNMAIREEKEEEEAAARRAEDARRTQLMEAQAAEARRHNAAMEQAEQERIMVEKDRAAAEEKARRDARDAERRAASEAYSNASRQCMVCAKRSGCRNPYVPGCGAFVPRR